MITEKERKEATYNYLKTNFEYSKNKLRQKQKFFVLSTIVIIGLIIIMYSLGGIYIPFFTSNNRYYDVQLNGVQLSTLLHMPDRTIIKNLIYLTPSGTYDLLYWPTKEIDESRVINDNKYILSVQSYTCYYSNVITDCKVNKSQLKKTNTDTKYKLRIYSHKNFEQISTYGEFPDDYNDKDKFYNLIYDDMYINNISDYIKQKGQYIIEIEARYDFKVQNIMTIILNDGKDIITF